MTNRIIGNFGLYLFLVCFFLPQRAFGNNEKLFFDEQKFVEIRHRIENEPYAKETYKLLQQKLNDPARNADFDPLWSEGHWVRDAAIYYRISGDEKFLPKVVDQIVDGFQLNKPNKKLFADTTRVNTYFWSWIMYRGGLFFAYDLIKTHKLFKPYELLMNQRLDEIIAEGFRYKNDIKRLGNTQFWGITGLGIAGFLRENKSAINEAINGENGFKAMLGKFRDKGRFWPEPILYSFGYVDCCLSILAEASLFNNFENLYNYTGSNGASISRMIDSYTTVSNPNGMLFVNGDNSETVNVIGSQVTSSAARMFGMNGNTKRTLQKMEIYNYRLKNPTAAWIIKQNPERNDPDFEFWGYTSLYFGSDLAHAQTPDAQSVVYPEMGNAIIKSTKGSAYWNSEALTLHFRNGASQQFHSHNDFFHFTLHAFGVNLYHDWFYKWDYLAPRASNGFRNKTPFSALIMNHNTVVVDFKEPDKSVIKFAQTRHEMPGVEFSEIKHTGDMQVISAKGEIYKGVIQQRTFAITKEYVIDIFEITSATPHNYDYIIHSYGNAEYPAIKSWNPYSQINEEYKLDKIDQKSNLVNNVWIASAQKSDANKDIIVNFKNNESTGSFTTILKQEGTQVISGSTPVKIEGVGWDESLKIQGLPERKPIFIARRNAISTTYFALHQPYKNSTERYQFRRVGNVLIVSGKKFTDTYNFLTGNYLRDVK